MLAKRTRVELSLAQTYEIVGILQTGEKQVVIAEKLKTDRSTVTKLKNNAAVMKQEFESGKSNVLTKLKKKSFLFEDIEEKLWFIGQASGTPGLTENLLLEKLRQIARVEGYSEAELISIDMNWINRFKN